MKARSMTVGVLLFAVVGLGLGLMPALAQTEPAPAATTPPPASDTGAVPELLEGEDAAPGGAYAYDPAGRRDPFRSLLIGRETPEAQEGLAGILIDELTLQGIWKVRAGFVAQMQGPNNTVWLVHANDQLMDGEVVSIGANEIVFRQQVNDPTRLKPFREIVKELVPTKK